ncbi:MAG: hypothetical protein M3Y64_11050, partial [Gemmatimonadota bacterium]|nr:hypothetical protein [Gemmatimonadota bacterium]
MSSSDMASSEPVGQSVHATAWSLEELEMGDIFVPFSQEMPESENPVADEESQEVLASPQERARIEAAAYAHGRADAEMRIRAELLPGVE